MRFNLKTMSFDELIDLRHSVEEVLSAKALTARRELEAKLAELDNLTPSTNGSGKKRRGVLAGTKVAPKYRNPKDKSQTWSGRGRTPLWLQAMLKQGHKIDEFAIRGSAAAAAKPAAKRSRGRKAKKK
jgi:DNA-binding protein H-NS